MTMSTKELTKKQFTKKVLEGRVAQILNARELVINIGAINGVEPGMIFAVLAESALEVRDPKTQELLDVIDREKVRVKAIEVRERITICSTFRTMRIGGGSFYPIAQSMETLQRTFNTFKEPFAPPKIIRETLAAEDSSLPPPLSPEESYVKINDRVVLVDE